MIPPITEWVLKWSANGQTAAEAAELHGIFLGFLDSMVAAKRRPETIAVYSAHLWMLGQEIMAFLHASEGNRVRGVSWYFANRMGDGVGPVPKNLKQKTEIRAYQNTCALLVKHIRLLRIASIPR